MKQRREQTVQQTLPSKTEETALTFCHPSRQNKLIPYSQAFPPPIKPTVFLLQHYIFLPFNDINSIQLFFCAYPEFS